VFKDRGLTVEMAHRAEAAGYAALCLTLDAKVKPKRERNLRNHYTGPTSPNYAHLNVPGSPWSFGLDGPTGTNDLRDPASTWADLDWLAAHTRLPLEGRDPPRPRVAQARHVPCAVVCRTSRLGFEEHSPSCPAWDEGDHPKYRIMPSSHLCRTCDPANST
jgi:FMN-dependent dehydrogenase